MSTEDNLIRLARVANEWWIGRLEGAPMSVSGNRLASPRVLGQDQGPLVSKWVCVEMIGKPTFVEVPVGTVFMDVTDESMIRAYREAVTGLTLASAMPAGNVIGMRRQ